MAGTVELVRRSPASGGAWAPPGEHATDTERSKVLKIQVCSQRSASSGSTCGGSTRAGSGRSRTSSNTSLDEPSSEEGTKAKAFVAEYLLEDQVLGTGAQSIVRQAIHRQSGRTLAVKSCAKSEELRETLDNLRGQCEIQSSLCHPHIARLEGVYETERDLHVVMEYLDGGELFERVAETGGMEEEAVAKLTVQLLRSIGYLHARGVVHRDLKTENIIFEKRGGDSIKLIDFGLATRLPRGQVLTNSVGTEGYSAPEVLAGRGYTEKADLWSLGAVVYFMLCGRPLYDGPSREVVQKSKLGHIDYCRRFDHLSQSAQEFMHSLLEMDCAKRLSAQAALAHPWLKEFAQADCEAAIHEVFAENAAHARPTSWVAWQWPRPSSQQKGKQTMSCFAAMWPGCLFRPE